MNRYLVLHKIVELGSFTKAAEALGYTQSAMSQMIASLENELSIKLLIRSRTGVKLTLEGAELYPYVERLVYQYWAAQGKAKEIKGLETLVLKEGAMPAVLPQGHPLAEREAVPLELLAKVPFILLEEGHYYEPLEAFRSVGAVPNIKYTIHDDYAIMTMVEAGLGVSILAELILHRTHYRLTLRPAIPAVKRTVAVGYLNQNSLPITSKYFINYLVENINRLP